MANFLTKILRKSGICRKAFVFLKIAKPFFILLYQKYNNNNHLFSSSDKRPSLLSFPALYSYSELLHLQKSVRSIFDFEQEHAFISHFNAKIRKEFVVKCLISDILKVLHKNGNC